MSEEDAFLDGIAADRTDRTRLLVFADWLADRSDPREEFIRLHTRLLDMDGTERGFAELEQQWVKWAGGLGQSPGLLEGSWLDRISRAFTEADVSATISPDPPEVERHEFGQMDHIWTSGEEELILYRGKPERFKGPFDFIARTVLRDLWDDPFGPVPSHGKVFSWRYLTPMTRGSFWRLWRDHRGGLRNPPPLPILEPYNHFLGAQYLEGDWCNRAFVAIHRDDYFGLFWSTTA